MDTVEESDEEVVLVHGDDVGDIARLVVESPAGELLGVVDGTIGRGGLGDAVHRVRIDSEGVKSSLVGFGAAALLAGMGDGGELVGLGIEAVVGLVAGNGGLLEDGNLLLEDRGGLLGDEDYVGSVNGVQHERLADGSLDDGLETGDHIGLGHPADGSEFTVCSGGLVGGIESDEVGEAGVLLRSDLHEAVGQMGGVVTGEKDMLHECGIRNHRGIHHLDGIEGVAGGVDRGCALLSGECERVDVGVDGTELSLLVPVGGKRTVGILEEEVLHVVRSGELLVDLGHLVCYGCNVISRRDDLEHHVLKVAAGVLTEEILMGIIIILYLVVGNDDGGIDGVHERDHNEVNVGGLVVLGDGAAEHQRVLVGAGVEESAVLLVELLGIDGVLKIVPVKLVVVVGVQEPGRGLRAGFPGGTVITAMPWDYEAMYRTQDAIRANETYIYEAYEQLGRIPENIIVPVGNGTLFIGVMKALEHLMESGCIEKMPQIIALQTETCDPLLVAAEKGLDHAADIVPQDTIAEGIAIGKPMRAEEILEYAYKYGVRFIHAPEDKILEARQKLAEKGIYIEHTTAANYAAYLNYCEKYGKTSDCLITMCGHGLKSDH